MAKKFNVSAFADKWGETTRPAGWTYAATNDPTPEDHFSFQALDGHLFACQQVDDSATDQWWMYKTFTRVTADGAILSFWVGMNTVVTSKQCVLQMYDGATILGTVGLRGNGTNIDIDYFDTAWQSTGSTVSANTFVHIKIVLDFTNDQYDIYLNKSLIQSNAAFRNSVSGITEIQFFTQFGLTDWNNWIDSIILPQTGITGEENFDPWNGSAGGVSNPSNIGGVDVGNISNVGGVVSSS